MTTPSTLRIFAFDLSDAILNAFGYAFDYGKVFDKEGRPFMDIPGKVKLDFGLFGFERYVLNSKETTYYYLGRMLLVSRLR